MRTIFVHILEACSCVKDYTDTVDAKVLAKASGHRKAMLAPSRG